MEKYRDPKNGWTASLGNCKWHEHFITEVREKSVSSDVINSLVNTSDNKEGGINQMSLLWALA